MLLTQDKITKSTGYMPAIHSAVHMYLFPSVTFSLHSLYTLSDELIFPCTEITQVTFTCYSFCVDCERNRTQGKLMDCQ